jgi:hypothetical protein
MKVSSLVFALLLATAPVVTCGSAYADGCSQPNCKSEDTPFADKWAESMALLTAPAPAAGVGATNLHRGFRALRQLRLQRFSGGDARR